MWVRSGEVRVAGGQQANQIRTGSQLAEELGAFKSTASLGPLARSSDFRGRDSECHSDRADAQSTQLQASTSRMRHGQACSRAGGHSAAGALSGVQSRFAEDLRRRVPP